MNNYEPYFLQAHVSGSNLRFEKDLSDVYLESKPTKESFIFI